MTTQTVEAELLGLEKRYWQAIKDKDIDAAKRLTDFPCIVAGAKGVGSVDENMFGQIMKSANYTLNRFEIKDEKIRMLRDDVAVVAYQVREELTVDGKPVTLNASDLSTWVRRDGRWVCAAHTESVAGDPYGRDRQGLATPSYRQAVPAPTGPLRPVGARVVPGVDTTPGIAHTHAGRPRRDPAPPRASPAPA